MATTQEDIRSWCKEAKKEGATHLLVVCDTFDYEDYPVSVMPGEDAKKKVEKYSEHHSMQKVMECYSLKKDIEAQLQERRCFNY